MLIEHLILLLKYILIFIPLSTQNVLSLIVTEKESTVWMCDELPQQFFGFFKKIN